LQEGEKGGRGREGGREGGSGGARGRGRGSGGAIGEEGEGVGDQIKQNLRGKGVREWGKRGKELGQRR
jgi:hypothetical protein